MSNVRHRIRSLPPSNGLVRQPRQRPFAVPRYYRATVWAGLRVVALDGGRPGLRRVAIRNVVKLLPWELAHIAVARLILGADAPLTIGTTYALSLLIPVASVVMVWRDPLHRALHDRVAGTRVVRS